jgi:hypothetical protein
MPPIAFQALAAIVALFVIFLTYMSTKTWRWPHVTLLFLVFVATFAFCIYAGMTLKTRAAWIKLHDKLEADFATAADQLEKTTRGDPKDVEGKTESLVSVREQLARTIIDRGRVWRGCIPSIRGNVITAATSQPPDPNNPAAAPQKKNNIAPKTIVHVFREAQKSPESPVVPAVYVGEFKVTAATDFSVTLEPTMPLAPEQAQSAQAPGATWALYETAPVDGHEWFAGPPEERTAALRDAAQASLERIPADVANRLIETYTRDGGEAKDTDPPEYVWYEVKFDQEYEVTVDAPIVNSIDADPFNTEGQAVLQRLRRRGATPDEPGKVTFGPKEGQINRAVLDQGTAQGLIDRGIATLEKKIYRRNLTDYERRFHSLNERTIELAGRVRQLTLDNQAMIAATQKADQQRALVEELKGKVTADLAKVRYEIAELDKYLASLNGRLTTVQTELSQLYRSNKAISRELAEVTARLTEDINRRTREATASVP